MSADEQLAIGDGNGGVGFLFQNIVADDFELAGRGFEDGGFAGLAEGVNMVAD